MIMIAANRTRLRGNKMHIAQLPQECQPLPRYGVAESASIAAIRQYDDFHVGFQQVLLVRPFIIEAIVVFREYVCMSRVFF